MRFEISDIWTFIALACLIIVVAVPTAITVNKEHNNRLLHVATTKIKETAQRCFDKEECKDNKITLKELYNKNYLEPIANPITKEYYNENSYVLIENETIKFIEIQN